MQELRAEGKWVNNSERRGRRETPILVVATKQKELYRHGSKDGDGFRATLLRRNT